MRRSSLAGVGVGLLIGCGVMLTPALSMRPVLAQTSAPANPLRPVIDKYCLSCHNPRLKTADLVLDASEPLNIARDGAIWEKVVRKLRTGAMPPVGSPRPDQAAYDGAAGYLEHELDRAAAVDPNPGVTGAFHRLSRTEYANAIADLLALDTLPKELDIALLLPADNSSSGFDNLGDLLFVSPTALDSYLLAAFGMAWAMGDPQIPVIVDRYQTPLDLPQDVQLEDAPVGTRGGVVIKTMLPVDGEYRLKIEAADAAREPHQLEVSVDGVRAHLVTVGDKPPTARGAGVSRVEEDKPIEVAVGLRAGPRVITVPYVQHSHALGEELVRPSRRTRGALPALASVTVSGPFNVTGVSDTPSRRRIFTCRPASASEEPACARQILSRLTRRAYRRASTREDV